MCLLCAKSERGGKHTSDEVKAGEAGAAPALATSTQQFGRGGGGGGGGRGSGLGVRGWGPLSLRWCSGGNAGGGDGRFGPMVLAGRSLQRAESWEMETRGEASHSVNQRGQAIQWFRSHCLNYAYSVIEIAPFRHYGEGLPSFQGMRLVVSMLLPFMRHLGPLLGGRSGLTRPVLLVKSLLFLAMFCLLTQVSQCCCH